jgi:Uma2 family endonuclease
MNALDFASVAPLRPLKRTEYDQLVDAGVFEGERVELLGGVLVTMSPQGAPHFWVIQQLQDILGQALAGRATVRTQGPLALSDDSEPEPDIAVVALGDYRREHPSSALLLVEVSRSSRRIDRAKGRLYAAAMQPEYWIVDVERGTVEVHTEPGESGYGRLVTLRAGDELALTAFPDVRFPVASILP